MNKEDSSTKNVENVLKSNFLNENSLYQEDSMDFSWYYLLSSCIIYLRVIRNGSDVQRIGIRFHSVCKKFLNQKKSKPTQ